MVPNTQCAVSFLRGLFWQRLYPSRRSPQPRGDSCQLVQVQVQPDLAELGVRGRPAQDGSREAEDVRRRREVGGGAWEGRGGGDAVF